MKPLSYFINEAYYNNMLAAETLNNINEKDY